MPKENKKIDKTEDGELTMKALKKQLDAVCSEVRRHSENWVRHMNKFHESGKGNVGRAAIGEVFITAAVTLLASMALVLADEDIANWVDGTLCSSGTAKVFYDSSQDDYSASFGGYVTAGDGMVGDIICDDINASGAYNATLDFNMGNAASSTVATITYKVTTPPLSLDDDDKMTVVGLQAYNTGGAVTSLVNYVTHEYVLSDVTSATEDGSYIIKIMKNGTDTTVSTLDATGLDIVGDVSGTTIGGITEANLVDKSATETIAGAWTFNGAVTIANTATINTVDVSNEASVDSKFVAVGPNETTGLMVLGAAVTATADALQTNTFATAFGAAPIVVCTYTEDPGDVAPIFVTSTTASNFICQITADKNFQYIAIGARP